MIQGVADVPSEDQQNLQDRYPWPRFGRRFDAVEEVHQSPISPRFGDEAIPSECLWVIEYEVDDGIDCLLRGVGHKLGRVW